MNPFDLQVQTTASDGQHSPRECVGMAKANGVHTMAITDHDTVAGVPEAIAAGKEFGVRVIPGIEISIQEHGMHLLGLGLDIENPALKAALQKAADNRLVAAKQMVENFQKGGFVVSWEDVLREAGQSSVIARPHIVAAIMKRSENREKLEGITTKHEFFERYFTAHSPYYVLASTFTPEGAIQVVHSAGGVAVWSHPSIPDFVGDCRALGAFLEELLAWELDGIELLNPAHTEADVVCLEELAGRHGLIMTAGSDFHERHVRTDEPWPRSASTIGDFPVYGRSIEGMLPALASTMERRRAFAREG